MSTHEPIPPLDPPASLLGALRRILRPLVRAMIHQQVRYPHLTNLIKSLYVETAANDFQLEAKRVTVSRLSLLTGINRREIKRISESARDERETPPSAITMGARILARWIGDTPWRGEDGRPRWLPRTSDSEPSFHELVASVNADLPPRSLLDEWLRLGVVEIDQRGWIGLRAAAFLPAKGYDEKAYFVGRNVRDHVSAAFENLSSLQPPFLERSVYYASLSEESAAELQALATELGQNALEQINQRARALRDSEVAIREPKRITFGVYFYATDSDAPEGEDPPSKAKEPRR